MKILNEVIKEKKPDSKHIDLCCNGVILIKKRRILIYWNPLKIKNNKKNEESLFNYRFEYENQKYIFNTNNNGFNTNKQ